MGDESDDIGPKLYVRTPLIHSSVFKKPFDVFLKLENTQPSGSFKARGISYHCQTLVTNGCGHLVSSSGGNAGLAVAYSGWKLGVKTSVFVPETTPTRVLEKLRDNHAEVYVKGRVWDETNRYAIEFVKENTNKKAALVHPFDHEDIWKGHSSIITELVEDMKQPPDAIVLSVGGGGLLCGILEGLHNVGWSKVPVIACETYGADCFYQAVEAGHLVTLPNIASVAKSLGALTVSETALNWSKNHNIITERVTDRDAVKACYKFANDHKMIVEPACGASLAAIYGDVIEKLQENGKLNNVKSVIIIVCGGHVANLQDIEYWVKYYNIKKDE